MCGISDAPFEPIPLENVLAHCRWGRNPVGGQRIRHHQLDLFEVFIVWIASSVTRLEEKLYYADEIYAALRRGWAVSRFYLSEKHS